MLSPGRAGVSEREREKVCERERVRRSRYRTHRLNDRCIHIERERLRERRKKE